ncbi:unnamed protein product [Larinioides sclopetarius]|uniref:Uncharacterized protein n=1 Tax=Larinioides sclopetarius TaxID=280406 RepID=A0AAV2BPI4_9ARAC
MGYLRWVTDISPSKHSLKIENFSKKTTGSADAGDIQWKGSFPERLATLKVPNVTRFKNSLQNGCGLPSLDLHMIRFEHASLNGRIHVQPVNPTAPFHSPRWLLLGQAVYRHRFFRAVN